MVFGLSDPSPARPGDREVRLDLHALHAALARVRMAFHPADAARGLHIRAEGKKVFTQRRVRRDGEGAVPQFAVEMFGVVALYALAGAEAHVDRAPCREQGGQGAHISGGRAAPAEARGEPREAGVIEHARRARGLQPVRHEIERLVPRDANESGVVLAAFVRVRAFHRIEHAVRRIGLLQEAERLHAHLAAGRVDLRRFEIRHDLGGDAVIDADLQQVGTGDTLVAVSGNGALVARLAHRHDMGSVTGRGAWRPSRSPVPGSWRHRRRSAPACRHRSARPRPSTAPPLP